MVNRTAMNKDHGLVFRSFIYLFEQLESRKNDATFVIKASYLEIYNEKVGKKVDWIMQNLLQRKIKMNCFNSFANCK